MKDLKRFSSEWWKNYWFYYKWHTIAAVVALCLIIGTIVDVVTRVKPDIDITIATKYAVSDEYIDNLKIKISELIEDVNNDGQKTVQASYLNINTETMDEMQAAMQQKLYLEFAAGDSFIFIMDRELFESYNKDGMFIDLDGENCLTFDDTNGMNLVFCVRLKRANEKADYSNTQRVIDNFDKIR